MSNLKFSLTTDEGEEIVEMLLLSRRALANQRNYLKAKEADDNTGRIERINMNIGITDRLVHMLDLRIAAAKDVGNA